MRLLGRESDYQFFCGEEFFVHTSPFDQSSLTRWRQRMGEEKLVALILGSLSAATRTGAVERKTGSQAADLGQPLYDDRNKRANSVADQGP